MTRIVADPDAEHFERLSKLQSHLNNSLDEIIAAAIDSFYRQKSEADAMMELKELEVRSLTHLEEEFADYKEHYPHE